MYFEESHDMDIPYEKDVNVVDHQIEEQYCDYKTVNYQDLKPFIEKYFTPSQEIKNIIKKIEKFTSDRTISVDKLCLNNLDLCYFDKCVEVKESKQVLQKLNIDSSVKEFENFELIINEHLTSLEVFMKEVTKKLYNKVITFFNIDKLPDKFTLNQQLLKSIVSSDIIDIVENKKEKDILRNKVDAKFFDLITDENKKYLYESINVVIHIIVNILKSFTETITELDKAKLKSKIENTIYVNVIRSTITNIEFKDKVQVPGVKKIKEIIKSRLGKELPAKLTDTDIKTDGKLFKKYLLPFYNLVILYFILDNFTFDFLKHEIYKFNYDV